MRKNLFILVACAIMLVMLVSCGSEQSGSSQQMNYKDLKSMVIDILKTEDAQKALQESATQLSGYSGSGGGSLLLSVQDQEEVRMAVKDVLISPDYDNVIKQLMTDTRFAGEFAKAVNKQNKSIHKELLKDPTYQTDLIKAMKTPEMDKMILQVLQSTQYRKEVMSLMQESLQNPLFKLEMLDLIKTAIKEELQILPDEKVSKGKESEDKEEKSSEGSQEEESEDEEEDASPDSSEQGGDS